MKVFLPFCRFSQGSPILNMMHWPLQIVRNFGGAWEKNTWIKLKNVGIRVQLRLEANFDLVTVDQLDQLVCNEVPGPLNHFLHWPCSMCFSHCQGKGYGRLFAEGGLKGLSSLGVVRWGLWRWRKTWQNAVWDVLVIHMQNINLHFRSRMHEFLLKTGESLLAVMLNHSN